MTRRRVVITGIGVVTPFGCALRPFWQQLVAGRSAVTLMNRDNGLEGAAVVCAPGRHFSADQIDPKSRRLMSPAVAFGVAAAQLAATDSGFSFDRIDPVR